MSATDTVANVWLYNHNNRRRRKSNNQFKDLDRTFVNAYGIFLTNNKFYLTEE